MPSTLQRWRTKRAGLLLGVAAGAVLASGGARAQTAKEMNELRALVREQSAALQALQRRLDGLERSQTTARSRNRGITRDQTALRAAEGGTPDTSEIRAPAPSRIGAAAAVPAQQATTQTPAAPPQGQPPLPVLSGNDRVQVSVSGQVNRMLLVHGDGSGKVDSYFADNNTSSTRLRVLGSARLDEDTLGVSAIEFDLRSNSSASVTRQSVNNNGGDTPTLGPFRIRRAEVGVQSAQFGSLLLGRGSTYTDGIAEFDLSGTDVAFYSYLPDSGGSLQFADRNKPFRRASDPTIGQVFDDFDGPRDDRIRYDSPSWRGFTVGGSVAQGLYWDAGVRYSGELSGTKVAAGLGFMNYTGTLPTQVPANVLNQDGDNSATTPFSRRLAGSFAFLLPNGLNFAASAGWGQHYGGCCGTGLIARNDSSTYYLKAGYQARIFSFGTTDFSIDGGQTYNRIQDGDVASRFGVQVNQQVIAKGIEVFAGWEHAMLRRVGSQFRDTDFGIFGSRVQF